MFMAGGPDLFVVCNNCQSEVSPYITECPYCGQRLRKRAPKLDREGRPSEPLDVPRPVKPAPPQEPPAPSRRSRTRPQREPEYATGPKRPIATLALVFTSLILSIALRTGLLDWFLLIVDDVIGNEWWRILTASFVYPDIGYQVVALTAIMIFGSLLERRHGAWATLSVYLLGSLLGFGLVAATGTASLTGPYAAGGNAPALALLCAWALRDVRARRAGQRDDDYDMLGLTVAFVLLLALPVASLYAHVLAGAGGLLTGLLLGLALARTADR